MIEKFQKYIEEQHLISKGDRILVALSGGIDSMVLAELLRKCGYDIAFAHCNFHLRGEDSDGDELFVRDYAARVGVRLFVRQFDTLEYVDTQKVSVEMAARELRYAWFNDLVNANEYLNSTGSNRDVPERTEWTSLRFDKLALAHHADDQIETFFINLLRGSGIKGLKAMQPRNGMYVRPLLWASREEINNFALENNIQWREDTTNQKTVYLRNKIRHELMPVFDEIKSGAREKIIESINHLASENQLYRQLLKEKISHIEKVEGVLHSIPKSHFEQCDCSLRHFEQSEAKSGNLFYQKQLLFEWIREFGFSFSQCESIFSVMDSEPGREFYSPDYQLVVEKDTIEIFPIKKIGSEKIQNLSENKNFSCTKFPKPIDFQIEKNNPNIAQLDFDKLKFPLKLRSWQHGDRFKPIGMHGTKLVSDFFNDFNFSEFQKRNTLILTDSDGEILWIVGYRIDDRFKITDKTKMIYAIIFG